MPWAGLVHEIESRPAALRHEAFIASSVMANAPFDIRKPFLVEKVTSSDNGIQQIHSGLSSLSFNPAMSQGVIKQPINGSFTNVVRQEQQPPYYSSPPMPLSPNFHQHSRPQEPRIQSVNNFPQAAPTNNYTASSPFIHQKCTFSPCLNTPVSSDGRFSHSPGKNEHDPLGSFLPPPSDLDVSVDTSQRIGRSDDTDLFRFDGNRPKSPFVATPRNRSNLFHSEDLNREIPLPPTGNLRHSSPGAMSPSPAPSGQILYEERLASWNGGSKFPAPSVYKESMSSRSNFDKFNSDPGHCGPNDTKRLFLLEWK